MIIAKTPVRVSFFGGGTDYPDYYYEHGGEVLATAVDKFSYITVTPRQQFHDECIRIAYSRTELANSIEELQHTAVRECLRCMGIQNCIEVNYIADLPARTGLGSSSAFVVCLLHALHAFQGKSVSNQELAYQAIEIEQDMLKENVGSQDQAMSAVGGFQHVRFVGQRDIRYSPVIMSQQRKDDLLSRLSIFYTGIQRAANEVAGEQIKRTQINVPYLNDMKALVGEARAVLEGSGGLTEFGKLLDTTWKLKRSLSSKISNPEIDEMYQAAMNAGAVGGKLLGAGAGGFLLIYREPDAAASVSQALSGLKEVDFKFEPDGSKIIYYQPPS